MLSDFSHKNSIKAKLALALDSSTTTGTRPSLLELDMFLTDQLAETRRKEVMSHIVHDPDIFDQWWRLSHAQLWIDEQSIAITKKENSERNLLLRMKKWLSGLHLPAVAGTCAVTLVAYIFVPALLTNNHQALLQKQYESVANNTQLSPPGAPWSKSNLTKSLPILTDTEQQRYAIRTGIVQGVAELELTKKDSSWRNWLSPESDKKEISNTKELNRFRTLGQWALLSYVICDGIKTENNSIVTEQTAPNSSGLKETFLSKQSALYDQLDDELQLNDQLLTKDSVTSVSNICTIARRILAIAVPPAP